jgi:(2Fe-2S) ferredoxin
MSVCGGCCCGTPRKHPDIDHDHHLDLLHELLGRQARIRVTDCLGYCAASNVITVTPSAAGRQRGGRTAWFGFVLDEQVITELAEWVLAGGPGVATLPDTLELHLVQPPRRATA